MRKMLTIVVVACVFMCQMSFARADYLDDLCGRWVGQTTVANNNDPAEPFIEVDMVIEITAIEEAGLDGRLFVGTVEFGGMLEPFNLTGIFFGKRMKASTVGTVVSALLSRDGTTMRGYYLDTLLIPHTQAHPQAGKFVLMKETE